ncbi:FAD-dependent oxidoreductase [Streptomyces sp. TRM 70351]|uniref:FAD-dependent oxidoreductase n=1 Tax=Streptomyces sp. TRM 70351 TaxID=3116552 RepID=UPI002E7BD205|nr:FAD-dependent oxidoreductase [Streptomyces sp. TRM 70351]MEE1928829.1 FAD-dependent oxidoreductase [Streptomyces sp. TRM 70351]
MRVGIAGAGTAGLTTAWLLDPCHETVVLEGRGDVGGNARTVQVRAGGSTHCLDLGVREVSDQFSLWSRLVRSAGLGPDPLVSVPASLTLRRSDESRPYLVGPHTPDADRDREAVLGPAWEALGRLGREASRWEEEDLDGKVTVAEAGDWTTPITDVENDVVHALPASVFGCGVEDVAGLSARGVGGFFAAPQPSTSEAPVMQSLRGGTQELARALTGQLDAAEVHLRAPLHRLETDGDRFAMIESSGRRHLVDAVVLAVPPYAAAAALQSLAGCAGLRAALDAFTYQELVYAAHLDPFGMPEDRKHWSTTNVTVHDGWSETTTWYGPGHHAEVFVSQITHRGTPRRQVARASFRTLLPTPAADRARRRLARHREEGLHFAGAYTRSLDSQEDAVVSAVDVARELAPASPRLAQLTTS